MSDIDQLLEYARQTIASWDSETIYGLIFGMIVIALILCWLVVRRKRGEAVPISQRLSASPAPTAPAAEAHDSTAAEYDSEEEEEDEETDNDGFLMATEAELQGFIERVERMSADLLQGNRLGHEQAILKADRLRLLLRQFPDDETLPDDEEDLEDTMGSIELREMSVRALESLLPEHFRTALLDSLRRDLQARQDQEAEPDDLIGYKTDLEGLFDN